MGLSRNQLSQPLGFQRLFWGPNSWRQSGHVPALGSQWWVEALQRWYAQGSRKRVESRLEYIDGSCFKLRLKSVRQTVQARLSVSSVSGSIPDKDWMFRVISDSKCFSKYSYVLKRFCIYLLHYPLGCPHLLMRQSICFIRYARRLVGKLLEVKKVNM